MSWNPTCRKARRALALWSGNDLDAANQVAVRRHMTTCPECREQWQRLQAGHEALEQTRAAADPAPLTASVWPAVERQLGAMERPAAAGWRGWLPAVALAAACLTIMLVTSRTPVPHAEQASSVGRPPVIFQRVRAPIIRSDGSAAFEHDDSRPLELPEFPRVRTLLDGSDARGL